MTIEDTLQNIYKEIVDVKKMLLIAFPEKFKQTLLCPRCKNYDSVEKEWHGHNKACHCNYCGFVANISAFEVPL